MIDTILAIETSLDDTAAAITFKDRVISNVVASQVAFHAEWGGTVPQIARRKHEEWMEQVINKAISRAGKLKIEAVAVTYGPGLAPSLEVGLKYADKWANKLAVPLIPINHLEAHLLSSLAKNRRGNGGIQENELHFPALGFLISGGHTELVLVKAVGEYGLLGETLDDAAGEAYDKVARMLGLGYPGGPILAELALTGNPIYKLPIPMLNRKDLNFSFSGLKTAAMHALEKLEDVPRGQQFLADFSASFQVAAQTHLMKKLEQAIKQYQPKMIFLGGGVVSNVELRKAARRVARKYKLQVAIPYSKVLFTDNAGMIGVTAWYKTRQKGYVPLFKAPDREPNLNFQKIIEQPIDGVSPNLSK